MKFITIYLLFSLTIGYSFSNNIDYYSFIFIKDIDNMSYKIHSLLPQFNDKCITEKYSNYKKIFTEPYDPDNFIKKNWLQTINTTNINNNIENVNLFEYNNYIQSIYMKLDNSTEFLNIVRNTYNNLYNHIINNNCGNYMFMIYHLDKNMNFVELACISG